MTHDEVIASDLLPCRDKRIWGQGAIELSLLKTWSGPNSFANLDDLA